MSIMVCSACGRTGIYWIGLVGMFPHTFCPHCDSRQSPIPEQEEETSEEEVMKAIKVEACWLCNYCSPGMVKCYHSAGPKTPLSQSGVHPSCPLPDWPSMTIEQVSAMFDEAVGIIGEGRGTRFIVDCLRARGVELVERKA